MPDEAIEPADIKETDIVFDCPHCSKSLAIDYRGAGLFIVCPDCQNRVQVPIPEGMEVSDFDSTEEEQAVRLIHLRESLAEAQTRIMDLEQEVTDLRQRREKLESFRTEQLRRFEELNHEVHSAEKGLARILDIIKSTSDKFRESL